MDQPKTQREMVQQMWFVLLGSNGDGLVERVKRIENKLDAGKLVKWIGGTVGTFILIGLLTPATYGIIHALEAVPTLGNHTEIEGGNR